MNFTLDSPGTGMFVDNRHSRPGEQAVYRGSTNPNTVVGYSVVAYLPNPSRTGNAIIFTDHFPYFEVLLKTYHLSGTSFNAEIVAYRAYPELH